MNNSNKNHVAILFDMDGVIVLTEPLKAASHAAAIKHFGGNVPAEYYYKFLGKSQKEVRASFILRSGKTIDPDAYTKVYRNTYNELLDSELEIRPGVKKLITFLKKKGAFLGLVSSSSLESVKKILMAIGFQNVFDVVISADDVKREKPNPEGYLLALERLGVSSDEAVVFEDSDSGIEAAYSAGIKVVGIRYNHNIEQEFSKAQIVLHSLNNTVEVIELIKKLLENNVVVKKWRLRN